MRFKCVLLFVCLINVFHYCAAQTPFHEYYNYINDAELAICDSNFKEANEFYLKAFIINPNKQFYRDLHNALCAALDSRRYDLAERYYKKLNQYEVFKKDVISLKKYYSDTIIYGFQKKFASQKQTCSGLWATDSVIIKLKEMVALDQNVRMYFSKKYDGAYMVDSVYKVDVKNARDLFDIFNKYGLPNECIEFETGYQSIIGHNSISTTGYRQGHIFDTLLYKGIYSFDYDVRNLPNLLQRNPKSNIFSYDTVSLKLPITIDGCFFEKKIYPRKYDNKTEYYIDLNRQKIGLCKLSELRKKIYTENKGIDGQSVFTKYILREAMVVLDVQNDEELQKCIEKNINEGKQKNNDVSEIAVGKIVTSLTSSLGNIHGQYIIGETHWFDKQKYRENIKRLGYEAGVVQFGNWKNRPMPAGMLYFVEAIPNSKADLFTEKGRVDNARFVSGYKILIERGFKIKNYRVLDFIQSIYDFNTDSTLISFYANTDTGLYYYLTKNIPHPTRQQSHTDTIGIASSNQKLLLKRESTIWIDNDKMLEITIEDKLNKKGRKYKFATMHMVDIKRYAEYTERVKIKLEELSKIYTR